MEMMKREEKRNDDGGDGDKGNVGINENNDLRYLRWSWLFATQKIWQLPIPCQQQTVFSTSRLPHNAKTFLGWSEFSVIGVFQQNWYSVENVQIKCSNLYPTYNVHYPSQTHSPNWEDK